MALIYDLHATEAEIRGSDAAAALTCPYLRGIDGYSTPDRNRVLALLADTAAETSPQVFGPAHQRTLV